MRQNQQIVNANIVYTIIQACNLLHRVVISEIDKSIEMFDNKRIVIWRCDT